MDKMRPMELHPLTVQCDGAYIKGNLKLGSGEMDREGKGETPGINKQ